MIRGIYTAAAGLDVQSARLDVISNNVANIATAGFKTDNVTQKTFPDLLLVESQPRPGDVPVGPSWRPVGVINQGAAVNGVYTDFTPGALQGTGKSTSLALTAPDSFFTVADPANPGGVLYTRDGDFAVDAGGYLVDARGRRVLGVNGPVQVNNANFQVDRNGRITVSGQPLDQLRIVQFNNPAGLVKTGDNYFRAPAGAAQPAVNPGVRQGYLEGSNVNAGAAMAGMVSALRAYESNQQTLQTENHLLDLAINQVGVLR
ncbi:flagellar hook-basal body protein [Desulfotomaculum copahuensis]|uniref:Uncharacterized protein n=1 Tax=Desulfotomaculum copahuensis TaxID=1838280 RepID=A0A1B7LBK0_9FIRM|nr:flagellar hook-basal body protein [Desulfotomaculum copahuensis]OAT79917.1 hypothetical protein A6M21_14500 [Desulfotomaculum copahuensis]